MARIEPIKYENMTAEAKSAHNEYIKKSKVNNMKLTLLHNVNAFNVLNGFHTLCDEAKKFLTELDVNLFCYAISFENGCMACSAIFKSFLDEQGVDFNTLILTPVQQALVSFGRNVADDPHEVYEDQLDELKEFFTDEQLVVITSLAAMMIASNIFNTVFEIEI